MEEAQKTYESLLQTTRQLHEESRLTTDKVTVRIADCETVLHSRITGDVMARMGD